MRTGLKTFFLASCLLLQTTAGMAETIVQKRIAATNRLLPLKKITVGPDDQYHGAVDPGGNFLVFTHKADLVPHLRLQDLKTGEVKDLLSLDADSQEPSFGPTGLIVFSYYKFNARGDICYVKPTGKLTQPLPDKEIHCLMRDPKHQATERSNPFWKSANEIGYVERDINTQNRQIIADSIDGKIHHVLADGRIWSPAMKAGGRFLVFNELNEKDGVATRGLVILDLTTMKATPLKFALPGLSGFPAISDDENYLYFSHYLNDTNNDNVIDGNDNAVVFRLPIAKALAAQKNEEIFPEQLTSVESSCSFPRPFQNSVYVTCAFEGSLDVYQMPATGIVPVQWNEPILNNALRSSRTYQDRILILNTMKYRLGLRQSEIEQMLLSNHILADDTSAAQYYLSRLEQTAAAHDKAFYALLRIFLQARETKKSQPSDEISRELQKTMQVFLNRVDAVRGEARLSHIVRGLVKFYLNQYHESESERSKVHFDSAVRPLERYLYFVLASQVQQRSLPQSLTRLLDVYHTMMAAPEILEEAQVYYAVLMLRQLEELKESRLERISRINSVNQKLPAAVSTLLNSEVLSLKLISAPEEKDKAAIYRDLDKLMSQTRDDYFLRKALYVRTILNFTEAAEFKYLSFIATNWLRYTADNDTEFIYAREVFAGSSLDQAYDSLGKKNYNFATNFFYESLSLTDDLESHNGYIHSMLLKNQRATINDRYQNLQKRQFIDDNMKFVQALLGLIDSGAENSYDPNSVKSFDAAIKLLSAMEQDRDSAVRYLFLGYCYTQKLLRLANGYDFDAKLFENAHRSLMLAYDIGRENDRIKASALMNLGILHERVQNHGLATKFFALRKKLGFEHPEDRAGFTWWYAKALYHNRQVEQAATELSAMPAPSMAAPYLEHQAFYMFQAGHYQESAGIYDRLLKQNLILGDENLAKAYLGEGYALFKLKKEKEAILALRESLRRATNLKVLPKGQNRLIDFQPARLQLIAYGLLGQVGTPTERISALEKRLTLLPEVRGSLDQWLPTFMQTQLQLARLYTQTSQMGLAVQVMRDTLKTTQEFAEANGYIGQAVFRSTVDYLAHGLAHPQSYEHEDGSQVGKMLEKTLQAYQTVKVRQPILDFQELKLEMLWAAYQRKILKKPGSGEMDKFITSELAQKVKTASEAQWSEIQGLSQALR